MSLMLCPNQACKYKVSIHERQCSVCGEDVGFPNVRACKTTAEVAAMEKRFKQAEREARRKGSRLALKDFQLAVKQSKAIICRPLSVVQKLMSSENELYTTFYNMIDSSSRIPEDNKWDKGRTSIDSMVFPHYHTNIIFAALSLNDRGVYGYGDHCLVLKTAMIQKRATVFNDNTFKFVQDKMIIAGSEIPPGFRATWEERDILAIAKLGGLIESTTRPQTSVM